MVSACALTPEVRRDKPSHNKPCLTVSFQECVRKGHGGASGPTTNNTRERTAPLAGETCTGTAISHELAVTGVMYPALID